MSSKYFKKIVSIEFDWNAIITDLVDISATQQLRNASNIKAAGLTSLPEFSMASASYGRQTGATEAAIKYAIEKKFILIGSKHTRNRFSTYTHGALKGFVPTPQHIGDDGILEYIRGNSYNGIIIDSSDPIPLNTLKETLNIVLGYARSSGWNESSTFPIVKIG